MNGLALAPIQADTAITFHADNTLEFKGQKFTPDATKGYFQFTLSHVFPVRTAYGTAIYPAVVAQSFNSLLHQNLNWEHHIAEYHKQPGQASPITDRVIGSIVAVDFPPVPGGGWAVNKNSNPGIDGVAVYYKLTQGMSKIIGDHQTGRHKYSVSMEVEYPVGKSGFAVAATQGLVSDKTPADMRAMGYEYWSWEDAPEALRATFSNKANKIVGRYKGQEVSILMGGLSTPVHYGGVGMVKYGAEPTAGIKRLTASSDLMINLGKSAETLRAAADKLFSKTC
jgi:hypothetical protein